MKPSGRLLRIASAVGHLSRFWQAVREVGDGVPDLAPVGKLTLEDGSLEQRFAALAADRFEVVRGRLATLVASSSPGLLIDLRLAVVAASRPKPA